MTEPRWSKGGVAKRTAHSAFWLGTRQVLVQAFGAAAGIALARLLSPADFGFYAVLTFFFYALLAIGDLGLGASLVRQPAAPSLCDMRLVLTVRQTLDLATLAVIWLCAPWLAAAFGRAPEDELLFRLVALAVFVNSLQIVPTVMLERSLSFAKLAGVEILQAFVFAALLVGLVWGGHGMRSVGAAWLGFSISGALLANLASPWRLGWHWEWANVRSRLAFALPYQAAGFVNLARDGFTPVIVGTLLGTAVVGYLNFAQMLAAFVVMGLMVLQRVYMPAFAKLQGRRAELGSLVERVIMATHALVAPIAVMTLALLTPITVTVFGTKWLTAIPLFYPLWGVNLIVPTVIPLLSLLNAVGQSRWVLKYCALSMLAGWLLGLALLRVFGPEGYAWSVLLVQGGALFLLARARRVVAFQVWPACMPPWRAAVMVGAALYLGQMVLPVQGVIDLCLYGAAGMAAYLLIMRRHLKLERFFGRKGESYDIS